MNRNLNPNNSWIYQVREYFHFLFSLPSKIWAQRKKILYWLLGLVIIVLSLLSYFLWRVGKNYFSTSKKNEKELTKEIPSEEELSTKEDSIFSPAELNAASQEQEQIIRYFRQIVTNIRSDNLHGREISPLLRTEVERVNNSPFLLCSVANCQWTAARLKCEHNCYLRCLEKECAFATRDSYQYQDYCTHHTCQQCSELVIVYEDNHCEKYCTSCLPNPSKF